MAALPHLPDAARELSASVRATADRIERERRLPADLVQTLAGAGLFRMAVPRALGGLELDAERLLQSIETVAEADGSAGWCVMVGATTGVVAAYLEPDTGSAIYSADARAVTGGVFAPLGRAVVADGGYRVTGRWPFASGCEHCSWLMGGSVIVENGAVRTLPSGVPDGRMMIFPAPAARIVDTWDVAGLRGTGSHDIVVEDVFVPAGRSVSLLTDTPRHRGPLYVFPVLGLLALGIAAVALGIGRRAIAELTALAATKKPTGSSRRLAERGVVQSQVAQSEATLRAARALLYDTVRETWAAAAAAPQARMPVERRAALRLAATHATTSAAAVVDAMYTAGGGTAIYSSSPLQRCLRDIHVATQHVMVAQPTYELAGRVLLGIETDTSQL